MFAGLSLFYPDVVIGRPGARCDALEAQDLIVSIPGARRCYQRTGLVNLGCRIYVHNLRDCAKMDEMLKASDWLLHPQFVVRHTRLIERLTQDSSSVIPHYSTPRASSVGPYNLTHRALHLERRPSYFTPRAWALLFHTSSVGPSQQTIALVNIPFRPVPKAQGPSRRGLWGPVNDNHYHYHLHR